MGQIFIVSKIDAIDEYMEIANQYGLGFEYNDFFMPDILDDPDRLNQLIFEYKKHNLPKNCTLHGVFFDIIPFSYDEKIRNISIERMEQSMAVAKQIGARGVVFHSNYNPFLESDLYDEGVIRGMTTCLRKLLAKYPDVEIYLENMFDKDPHIMRAIAEQLKDCHNFGLCLDYAHASLSGTAMDSWVMELAPFIRHLHINDNDFKSDLHLPVGAGNIDWKLFKKYYENYFPDSSILIETTKPDAQRKSLEYMINELKWKINQKQTEI